jgi:SAM-dependent methyltransferase
LTEQTHRSDPRVLNRRTLERDHRALAAMLRPGMTVLDIGCGTGAITAGIANAVGSAGRVVGVDRDGSLLESARLAFANIPGLRFEFVDALSLEFEDQFDIVTAARAVQWMADPARAVGRMARAAKPGGAVVVLDYNHDRNSWAPDPPPEFARFYAAFLAWRASNGWANDIADRLPEMFEAAGLVDIAVVESDEVVERGAPGFEADTAIWGNAIESIGPRFCPAHELTNAADRYRVYCATALERQTLSMRTVTGKKPL